MIYTVSRQIPNTFHISKHFKPISNAFPYTLNIPAHISFAAIFSLFGIPIEMIPWFLIVSIYDRGYDR